MAEIKNTIVVEVIPRGQTQLIAQMDRLSRSVRSVADEQLQADKVQTQLNNSIARLNNSQRQQQAVNDNAVRSVGAYRAGLQNLGFQMQDVAVQVAGGTSAFRALGQQLPQALGAVTQMTGATSKLGQFLGGPWGIALGVAVAALAPLIGKLFETKDAADSTAKSLREAARALTDGLFELDQYGKVLRDAESSALGAMRSLIQIRQQIAQAEKLASSSDPRTAGQAQQTLSRLRAEKRAQEEILKTSQAATREAIQAREAEVLRKRLVDQATEQERKRAEATAQTTVAIKEQAAALTLEQQAIKLLTDLKAKLEQDRDKAFVEGLALSQLNREIEAYRGLTNATKDQIGILENMIEVRRRLREQMGLPSGPATVSEGLLNQGSIAPDLPKLDLFEKQITNVDRALEQMGQVGVQAITDIGDGIARAISGAESFAAAMEQVGRTVVFELTRIIAKLAIIEGLKLLFPNSGLIGGLKLAKGGVIANGQQVTAFARGGIVNGPTLFPMRNGLGLMGEAGAEAVVPLRRGRDGKLGVNASPVNVTVINNVGAQVSVQETADGMTIKLDAVQMAERRIVDGIIRGGSPISRAIEGTYGTRRRGA